MITGTLCSLDEGHYRSTPRSDRDHSEIEWAQRHKFEIYDFGAGTYDYGTGSEGATGQSRRSPGQKRPSARSISRPGAPACRCACG
ncbi:MAG: hypothetical protein HPM95_11215 [Alphaproteobacteria bacterium]|nr:hypothetical protein [Alphaproteobacteria bacterium]